MIYETRDVEVGGEPLTDFSMKVGEDTAIFSYPKLYTLAEFLERYGVDNCTIMLQDREQFLYRSHAVELLNSNKGPWPDRYENVRAALKDWKPCDDRPPTDLEIMAKAMLALPAHAQAVVRGHINASIEAKKKEQAAQQAEVAAKAVEKQNEKYTPEEPLGPPVTTFQTEPDLESFEEQGRINDETIKAAQVSQEPAIAENLEDYVAPTEFEDGSTEDAVIEQPPQDPAPRGSP